MLNYRNATLTELQTVLDWAAEEGWNPGLDDAGAFFAADPGGFFLATDGGAPVAAISVVNHNPGFAFLGLYMVRPSHRGRGIGFALWQHALAHAGERTVGLDGVPAQQQNYAASGFVMAGGTTRFSGHVPATESAAIGLAGSPDLPELIQQEATASGQQKPRYLTEWFTETTHRKTLVLRRNAEIQGFCTTRRCREGAKIGPLWCNTAQDAETLIQHAASLWPGDVVIDVPAASRDLVALCKAFGMSAGFETARMYRGHPPRGASACFAVASLELG
ncbi:GCN5-related N-acetyltransferase [Candidatus Rhodobacter oscarellae]|uniref:GCN5-related N-acetyltransferase n=1 Tax=Candidatus Rhodobacter oscarellae TaxID=1675527 RepID=A0A0J9EDN4_9RHOB|nr:GNAT family N-acetyltransferase [Candidatus Rhodobacter lobularis]KMW60835.1 GCN5-related N-acetyltransferase [Candidatus Rhodobacter lobularis]